MHKSKVREIVKSNLGDIITKLNEVLLGNGLAGIKPSLSRMGRGGVVPHWFESLSLNGVLPNLDGKTIGSVLEMLFVVVIEQYLKEDFHVEFPLSINPAKGVDIPEIELGIKSPSTNYCTSEPFFSAYERLLGSEYDVVVLLTDYQEAKKRPPLKLQIIDSKYLEASEIADRGLCAIAKEHRKFLLNANEAWAKKVVRFLSFVNQGDWLARHLILLVKNIQDEQQIKGLIKKSRHDFVKENLKRDKSDSILLPDSAIETLENILNVSPIQLGVVDALDNWIVDEQKDIARLPNDNEWNRILKSPLNGKIGMSFALQWRYNFGSLFRLKM